MKKALACTALLVVTLCSGSALAASLSEEESLGRFIYEDKNLSLNGTQSCATCHHRSSGFADPENSDDPENSMSSLGDDGESLGGRNSPTAAYCGFSPILAKHRGEWVGGMFWDGRATGDTLRDPLAEQAKGPFLNPVEMQMGDAAAVLARIEESHYAGRIIDYFDDNSFFATDKVDDSYDKIAKLIAAYERSFDLNPFNSAFDKGTMSEQQLRGLDLFMSNCTACHSGTPITKNGPVLFTTYGYANIGVPMNDVVNSDQDLGLGLTVNDRKEDGKFKIPTLRNITLTAPYSHNGYFTTLTEMVAFHNDRGVVEPDVERNISDLVGNMGLSVNEIDDIVAFLGALTDGSK